MTIARFFAIFAVLFILTGCTSTKKKRTRLLYNYTETLVFDKSIPFPTYGTYNWFAPNAKKNKEAVKDHQLLQKAIRKGFLKRGFRLKDRKNVNFYVAYYFKDKPTIDSELNSFYKFKDEKRWRPGIKNPAIYAPNTLIIDIVCADDHCPRWRGSLQFTPPKGLTDEEHKRLIDQVAVRLLKSFPPKGAK